MDRSNFGNLQRVCPPVHRPKLRMALEHTSGAEVPDPYYGGPGGFRDVYDMLDEAMDAWLAEWLDR